MKNKDTERRDSDHLVKPSDHLRRGLWIGVTILFPGLLFKVLKVKEPAAEENAALLPPPMGEALVALFCSKNRARYVMGCLEENFHEDIRTKGKRRAKLLYWAAVLRSIGPLLWVKLRRAGLIALLVEIGRRWSGLS
jgi:hypothetical protein